MRWILLLLSLPAFGQFTPPQGSGSAQVYPGAGIANSTGSAWGTSYTTSGSGTVVALATSPTFTTPSIGVASGTSVTLSSLTSGRIPFASTGGLLADSAAFVTGSLQGGAAGGQFISLSSTDNNAALTIKSTGNNRGYFGGLSGVLGVYNTSVQGLQINTNGGACIGMNPGNTNCTNTLTVMNDTATTGATRVSFSLGAADSNTTNIFTIAGTQKFGGNNTTAVVAGVIGTTCPAVTCTAAYTWVQAVSSDGSTVYFPVWK